MPEATTTEIFVGVVGLCFILGLAGFATWMFFWGGDLLETRIQRRSFPVEVPGWKTLMAEHPPFRATARDVGLLNSLLLKHAVAAGYPRREVRKKLDSGLIRWVAADPSLDGRRAVNDPYGRTVMGPDGKAGPLLAAGWHSGNHIFVVYRPNDFLENVAYAHEQGHGIHEVHSQVDYDHSDKEMWGGIDAAGKKVPGIVNLAKNEFRLKAGRGINGDG